MDRIGFGGFATVYRARQPGLDRTVAIKVVQRTRGADDETLRRFRRECQAIGSLTGTPAVMTVFDLGTTPDGDPYLVLEYLEGGSLEDELHSKGRFEWEEVVRIAADLTGALDAAHGLGILHRDVKPANVLRDRYGAIRLGDFGIAHFAGVSDTSTTDTAMTISYAAPEMLQGAAATSRSDFYSLGALLYTLLNGRPPFSRPDDNSVAAVITRITTEPPPPLPESSAPAHVRGLIDALMAKEPSARPDASAVLDHLAEFDIGVHRRRRADRPDRADRPAPVPTPGAGPPSSASTLNTIGRRFHASIPPATHAPTGPPAGGTVSQIRPGASSAFDSAAGLSGQIGRAVFDSGLRGRHSVGGLGYAVDIVFVIDITASMWPVLRLVKDHAMGFHERLTATMQAKGKYVSELRVRAIAYRDYLDFADDAMVVTPFYELPRQLDVFRGFVAGLRADGGGDEPESGLEALAVAMTSPWNRSADRRRQVVVVCTDASAHPLEAAAARVIPGYPPGLPRTFDELTDVWEADDVSGSVNHAAKRLLLYTPDAYPWNVIATYWDSVLHFPSRAGEGLSELDFGQIVEAIAGSV
ncbi:MAG: protein kinase [Actinobacteria bacterium]|nr:protein kinase [Actinomycetota bacterium]